MHGRLMSVVVFGKKDKKGKKAKEEKLTPHEALLAHQIQMYQNTISETNDEIQILGHLL